MPQMTPAQARVVDPVLTEVARGYKNTDVVGGALFPAVPVAIRGGKIVTFRKEDFRLYATGRVPGANTKRIQYGYDGSPFALEQHALEGLVPFEIMDDANVTPGIDHARVAVMKTQNIIALRLEKQQADIATTAATYAASNKVTLSGTAQWSDSRLQPHRRRGDRQRSRARADRPLSEHLRYVREGDVEAAHQPSDRGSDQIHRPGRRDAGTDCIAIRRGARGGWEGRLSRRC